MGEGLRRTERQPKFPPSEDDTPGSQCSPADTRPSTGEEAGEGREQPGKLMTWPSEV